MLAHAGADEADEVADSILDDLQRTLTAPEAAAVPQSMARHLFTMSPPALAEASEPAIDGFAAAVDAAGWLPPPVPDILRVEIACDRRVRSAKVEAPASSTVHALVADGGAAAFAALARWIGAADPVQLHQVLLPRLRGGRRLPNVLNVAIQDAATRWSPEQRADLLGKLSTA